MCSLQGLASFISVQVIPSHFTTWLKLTLGGSRRRSMDRPKSMSWMVEEFPLNISSAEAAEESKMGMLWENKIIIII